MASYSISDWKQKGKKYYWNGREIFFIDEDNDKPPLVLIHGFPTASLDWHKVWDDLAKNYRVITLDMIGFGFSDKPKVFNYSIHTQATIIIDLLKKLKVTSFHILAHDYGDSVAQEIISRYNAFTYQDLDQFVVLSACLTNGGIFPEVTNHLLIQKMLLGPFGYLLSQLLNQSRFDRSFRKVFGPNTMISDQELKEYWQLVSRRNGHKLAYKVIKYLKEREEFNEKWIRALKRFRNPLGLINGTADPISGMNMVDAYVQQISNKRVQVLEGIGHYPQLEAPDQFLQAYNKFMKSFK